MPATITPGTQTAVISTEHTLATVTAPGTYVLLVDVSNLASGDTLELRIYTKVQSGSSSKQAYFSSFVGVQSDPVTISVPVPAVHEFRPTLKQTLGTGRSFEWEVVVL